MSKSTDDLIRELEGSGILTGSAAPVPVPHTETPAARPGRGRLRDSTVLLLILAVILVAVVGSLPYGSTALYPFALFVTLVHESSHAIASLLTGGTVHSLKISPDLSGVTWMGGGITALEASAGYIGATLTGVALLLIPLRFSRWTIGALAAIPLIGILLFHPADTFTFAWALGFAAALGLAAYKLSTRFAAYLQIFLGVVAGLNAFRDLMTLVFISGDNSHIYSDAYLMSQTLFGPPIVWAILWAVLSLLLMLAALSLLFRRDLDRLRR